MFVQLPISLANLRQTLEPIIQPSGELQNSLNGVDLLAVRIRGGGKFGHDWVFELQTRKGIIEINNSNPDFDPFYDWIDRTLNIDMAQYLARAHEEASSPEPAQWCETNWNAEE